MTMRKKMSADMSALIKSIKVDRIKGKNKELELKSIKDRVDEKVRKLDNLEAKERYFFDNLYNDPNFGKEADFDDFQDILPELATNYKRTATIYLTFAEFIKKTCGLGVYTLNKNIVSNVVERYLEDLDILKIRYNCPTVQVSKIAGLMTNLIVKYRPVVPLDTKNDPYDKMNELFAIHHALCICTDFSDGAELEAFENSDMYDDFMEDMKYLLIRNFTSENLIMVFKTLCLYQFKSFLKKELEG